MVRTGCRWGCKRAGHYVPSYIEWWYELNSSLPTTNNSRDLSIKAEKQENSIAYRSSRFVYILPYPVITALVIFDRLKTGLVILLVRHIHIRRLLRRTPSCPSDDGSRRRHEIVLVTASQPRPPAGLATRPRDSQVIVKVRLVLLLALRRRLLRLSNGHIRLRGGHVDVLILILV